MQSAETRDKTLAAISWELCFLSSEAGSLIGQSLQNRLSLWLKTLESLSEDPSPVPSTHVNQL